MAGCVDVMTALVTAGGATIDEPVAMVVVPPKRRGGKVPPPLTPATGVGLTPLILAAREGHVDAVRALIALGADCKAVDAEGLNAQGWAELLEIDDIVACFTVGFTLADAGGAAAPVKNAEGAAGGGGAAAGDDAAPSDDGSAAAIAGALAGAVDAGSELLAVFDLEEDSVAPDGAVSGHAAEPSGGDVVVKQSGGSGGPCCSTT